MFIPASRLIDVIGNEFEKVCELIPDGPTEASSAQSISLVLRLLKERQSKGDAGVRAQFASLKRALADVTKEVPLDLQTFDALEADFGAAANLEALETIWVRALAEAERLVVELNVKGKVDNAKMARLCNLLINFEAGDFLSQLPDDESSSAEVNTRITRDKLQAYLRDRFSEPGLELTGMKPLAGGFGKETILFTVKGKALDGDFVMRRDIGDNSGISNDCHKIYKEYPVIRAAFERGFPAPDALWLDTEHALLPGSDFIIMRRSEGESGGSFFGASGGISDGLCDVLAGITAKLHGLPPLEELGDLTESICAASWQKSKSENIESYIGGWYEFWLNESHNPSPAIASLYGWLLGNIPERSGAPSLLHGDIGFHNFLLQDGEINAVLDWEFAHVGDPAEDLGYIKTALGDSLDWEKFMASYVAAGGSPVDDKTINYFQVWAYVRNASAANLVANMFVNGVADDLKLSVLPYIHSPHFIQGALAVIKEREAL